MELNLQNRTILAKKTKHLRKEGLIPVELYGNEVKNKHLQVRAQEFQKVYRKAGHHTIITANVESEEKIPVFITEVQTHPVSREHLSANLRHVRMDMPLEAKVPIEYTGELEGARDGFMLVKVLSELEIETLPANIPANIPVDISVLKKAGDTIRVHDLVMPQDIRILTQPETVIASLSERVEEEPKETPKETVPQPQETTEENPTTKEDRQ